MAAQRGVATTGSTILIGSGRPWQRRRWQALQLDNVDLLHCVELVKLVEAIKVCSSFNSFFHSLKVGWGESQVMVVVVVVAMLWQLVNGGLHFVLES